LKNKAFSIVGRDVLTLFLNEIRCLKKIMEHYGKSSSAFELPDLIVQIVDIHYAKQVVKTTLLVESNIPKSWDKLVDAQLSEAVCSR
jgi:hypothetical protein